MAGQVSTHQISIDPTAGLVTKRFAASGRGEPHREWHALTLLAEHAPGLAPRPLRADLSAALPMIEMSWLSGDPLSTGPVTSAQAGALARALDTLWRVPLPDSWRAGCAGCAEPVWRSPPQLLRVVGDLIAEHHDLGSDPVVRCAYASGTTWLAGAAASLASLPEAPLVLGQSDGNLANFLWDGERVQIVDFEDSGLSDRGFELGTLVEHVSASSGRGLDADSFLGLFDLARPELSRLAESRRLAALFWLMLLHPGGASSRRNPPGTLRRQADRLLALL